MASVLPTLEVPQVANVPAGAPAAPEWLDTRGRAQRASDRAVDVASFRAGATSAAAAIQAALTAAQSNGIRRVILDRDDTLDAGLTLPDGVVLDLAGRRLTFTPTATPVSGAMISGTGTTTPLPALAAPVPLHSRSLSFAAAPDVVVGDVLIIQNSVDGSFSTERTYYRQGEFVRVTAVSGSTVTLNRRVTADYAADGTVTVHKMTPIRTGVIGGAITFRPGAHGISIAYGADLEFERLNLSGTDHAHLQLSKCYEVSISRLRAFDASAAVGLNYGISLGNSQRVAIDHVFLDTTRHGFVTGGDGAAVGAVPNREITVTNSTISGNGTGGHINGCNTHGNTEDIVFATCHFPAGLALSGDRITVADSHIWSGPNNVIHMGALLGLDVTITNCDLYATASHASGEAHVYGVLTGTLARRGGTFRFVNNRVHIGSYGQAGGVARAVRLYQMATPHNELNAEFSHNLFISTRPPGTLDTAVVVRSDPARAFRQITVAHNDLGKLGVSIDDCGAETLVIDGNRSDWASSNALRTTMNTSPVYTLTAFVRNNTILRSWFAGTNLIGSANARLILTGNTILDCNESGTGTSTNGTNVHAATWGEVISRDNQLGTTRATPKIVSLDDFRTITKLWDVDNIPLGSVTAKTRVSVGATVLRTVA